MTQVYTSVFSSFLKKQIGELTSFAKETEFKAIAVSEHDFDFCGLLEGSDSELWHTWQSKYF